MDNKEVSAESKQDKIKLPKGMTKEDAIENLRKEIRQGEEEYAPMEVIPGYPPDAAHALMMVLQKMFGWTSLTMTPTMFGPKPPELIGVVLADGSKVEVPFGRIQLPGIEGHLQTQFTLKEGRPVFVLGGLIKRKSKKKIDKIARLTRKYVKENSIYKGQAIRAKFEDFDEDTYDPRTDMPKFMDLSGVDESQLTFTTKLNEQIKRSIFTPIEQLDLCRTYGIPLKRSVLLKGKYGTGKTLTARVAAKKAVKNKWTYVYVEQASKLENAIKFALDYAPCVLFVEDVDRIFVNGQAITHNRTDAVDGMLNILDGIESKGRELLTIFTTNNLENIHSAMLRPGRLDDIIFFESPDLAATKEHLKKMGTGLFSPDFDYDKAAGALEGQIPANIQEVITRAKLALISQGKVTTASGMVIDTETLVEAAESMDVQRLLMQEKVQVEEFASNGGLSGMEIPVGVNPIVFAAHLMKRKLQEAGGGTFLDSLQPNHR